MPHSFPGPTIASVRSALLRGDYSASELLREVLGRISALQPHLNCFTTINERCIEEASRIDRSDVRPLAGIPMTVKDLILTRDMPTSAGSRVPHPFRDRLQDARCVRLLRKAGALIVGKTSLHEFAFGVTNENERFGPVHNPWNSKRMSGGSSGGSACALAARLCWGSIGTDTRGSIRIPSACCGVSGLKPTRGMVSTNGVIPLSPTLDHVGPMANSVADLEALFAVLAPAAARRHEVSRQRRSGWRVLGVAPYYFDRIEEDVAVAVRHALRLFEDAGFPIVEVDLPELAETLEASDVISRAEALAFHEQSLKDHGDDYDSQVRSRLLTGHDLSAVELVRAYQQRQRAMRSFQRLFRTVDCLVCPGLPVTAPPLGTKEFDFGTSTESLVHCFVRLMAPQNMAGVPSLTIPCGFSTKGLPIGLQLVSGPRREAILFELGAFYQEHTNWHLHVPPIGE